MIRPIVAVLTLAIPGFGLGRPAYPDSFPPVTDEERALKEVPGEPGAPAVVLFRKAELELMDFVNDSSSSLDVHERIKILTDEGRGFGEIEVAHNDLYRLEKLEGRTVQPDGTEVPLPSNSVFREETSWTRKPFVTRAVFPAAGVGAIVEVRYTLTWEQPYYFEPWYFLDRIPTLLSEITYDVPGNMALETWRRETVGKIRTSSTKTDRGVLRRVWMEDLPAVPDEPHTFPFSDLSTRFTVVPTEVTVGGARWLIFDSWESVCATFEEDFYQPARGRSAAARQRASNLATGAEDARAKAAAVYSFVRDDIAIGPSYGVFVDTEASVDNVLKSRRGTVAEKALLLQVMLESLGLEAKLVWVGDRTVGRIDLAVANPTWFEKMIVRVAIGDEEVFLDPTDRRLGFARLSPLTEGTRALLVDKEKPEVITLPQLAFDDNTRSVVLDLEMDEDGRVSGSCKLRLDGHHAWSRLRWKDGAKATAEAWKEWLDDRLEGYISNVIAVEESIEEQRVNVTWFVSQGEGEVRGDETSLEPCRPLGPVEQPFTLAPDERRTPVQLLFADRGEVELRLRWEEDWQPAVLPDPTELESGPGGVMVAIDVDETRHRLVYRRRFDLRGAELGGRDNYVALRDLFERMEISDAQELILVKR